ncbi:MAG: hypothetical protein J3K34DRAFT_179277 [Monoraphidium minutum]|nr:MAG: hypothetical protein J3K34DRAFT_179277 [Monoraphidium minutum]
MLPPRRARLGARAGEGGFDFLHAFSKEPRRSAPRAAAHSLPAARPKCWRGRGGEAGGAARGSVGKQRCAMMPGQGAVQAAGSHPGHRLQYISVGAVYRACAGPSPPRPARHRRAARRAGRRLAEGSRQGGALRPRWQTGRPARGAAGRRRRPLQGRERCRVLIGGACLHGGPQARIRGAKAKAACLVRGGAPSRARAATRALAAARRSRAGRGAVIGAAGASAGAL